jgi:hypothetical protein
MADRECRPGQGRAVTQRLAEIAQLARRHVRLGQKPRTRQVRERLGVDRVCLHACGSDRPDPERVRQVQVYLRPLRSPVGAHRLAADEAPAFPGVRPVNLIAHHREHTIEVPAVERLIQAMKMRKVIHLVLSDHERSGA